MRTYVSEMTLTDYMSKEREEVDLAALKTALGHRYNDSKLHRKVRKKTDHSHQKQYRLVGQTRLEGQGDPLGTVQEI